MRKGIHPLQRALTVVNTQGASWTVLSTVTLPGGRLFLQQDTTSHPAWTLRQAEVTNTGRAARFRQRFGLSPPAEARAQQDDKETSGKSSQ